MTYLLTLCFYLLIIISNNNICFTSIKIKNHASSIRYCNICDIKFRKISDYDNHMNGKRHLEQINRIPTPVELWNEFTLNATSWSKDCIIDDILPLWSNDELSTLDFKYRSSCLHPTPTIKVLNPKQKSRVWRYIRDVMGLSYYSEMASIIECVDTDENGHLRIKEVFESFETYRKIARFIIDAQKTLKDMNTAPIKNIVELACGHGLVGTLLAYRFPNLQVHLFDLHQRPTFNAFLRAYESKGIKRPGATKVLPNIIFHEANLNTSNEYIENSIVVCIHGCGQVNKNAIELAIDNNASGWVVLPCCIEKDMYLGDSCGVELSDDTIRHVMLCGALANEYHAQLIDSIDTRITNRAIIIAGGVGQQYIHRSSASSSSTSSRITKIISNQEHNSDEENNTKIDNDLTLAIKRNRMPKLIRS